MNLPNKLTLARIIAVPFFVVVLLLSTTYPALKWVALVIFCAASFTDYLDGHIARSQNLVTDFGKFADPIADKLLTCSAFICFVQLGSLPAWVVIIIVSREFIISGLRLVAAGNGVVIAASKWGKAKTVSQMIAIILLLMDLEFLAYTTIALIIIMTALTLISLIDYMYKNREVFLGGIR